MLLPNFTTLLSDITGNPHAAMFARTGLREAVRGMLRGGFLPPLVATMMLVAMAAMCESSMPLVFRYAVDALASPEEMDPANAYRSLGALLGLGLAGFLFRRLQQMLEIHIVPRLSVFLQERVIDHLLGLSPAVVAERNSGTLVQSIKSFSASFIGLVQLVTGDFINILVVVCTIGVVLVTNQPDYAAILACWSVCYLFGVLLFTRQCFRLGVAASLSSNRLAGEIGDTLLNFETVFNFARFNYERSRIASFLQDESERARKLMIFVTTMRAFAGLAAFSLLAAMTYAALRAVLTGHATIGMFVLAFGTTNIILVSVLDLSRQLLSVYANIGTIFGALVTLADASPFPQKEMGQKPFAVTRGEIRFRDVKFGFPGKPVLFDRLNLSVRAGEKVGLVGASSAGKTTLLRLLLNQMPVTEGAIEIDGQDIHSVPIAELQEGITSVSQNTSLFNRSFRDNIAYGYPDAEWEAVFQASRKAQIHGIISDRFGGYDSVTGQAGFSLSGGERQRICIARAIMKERAPILLLDEATSALDSDTEQEIQRILAAAFENRTVIAIAHRLSTIRMMDRIVYLENGAIAEQGSHDSLLAANGRYAKLWALQQNGGRTQIELA